MNATLAAIDGHAATTLILNWMQQAILFGTALAALTWLMTWTLRHRIHPALEGLLWCVVLVKFLVPVGPAWSFPLAGAGKQQSPISRFSSYASQDALATPLSTADIRPSSKAIHPPANPRADTEQQPHPWPTALVTAYVAAAGIIILRRLRTYRSFLTRCRALPPADGKTRNLVADVCRRLGVRRSPSVRIGEEFPTPFVVGLFRPLLVLSRRQLVRPDELETVVVHEVAHLRRGDTFVRYVQWVAGVLLFFWPVVAWVNRRIDVAREYVCDEWALRHGKLAPDEYAQCLLRATQALVQRRLAYQPCGMAGNHTNIERRIDMILESNSGSIKTRKWGPLTLVSLIVWGGFALTGGAAQTSGAENKTWPATVEGVREHAIQLYNRVAEQPTADLNADGFLSYREKSTYLIALTMQMPGAFMEEFPYADRDHSGRLDVVEAHDTIRGITLIAYADRRPNAAPHARLDLEFYHMALDAQEWLLDNKASEPNANSLADIWAVVVQLQESQSDHKRKLNHGAPERAKKCPPSDHTRFRELEGNIASIEARLADEADPDQIARLKMMLAKLEDILARLQEA